MILATAAGAGERPQVGLQAEAFSDKAVTSQLTSSRPAEDVARCWKRDGRFVPIFSRFTGSPKGQPYVYRLAEGGRLYERITLSPDAQGFAVATVEISPRYDAGWSAMVERDRLEPLRRCLGPAPVALARP
jgi:hypothetical protein